MCTQFSILQEDPISVDPKSLYSFYAWIHAECPIHVLSKGEGKSAIGWWSPEPSRDHACPSVASAMLDGALKQILFKKFTSVFSLPKLRKDVHKWYQRQWYQISLGEPGSCLGRKPQEAPFWPLRAQFYTDQFFNPFICNKCCRFI